MPNLLAIVEVDKEKRVQCGQPGCGHVVYKAIHIIQEGDELLVLGSTCFAKRYEGFKGLGETIYGGGAGRKLTDAQRELLMNNTAELLAQFKAEDQEQLRLPDEALSQPSLPSPNSPLPPRQMAYRQLSSGSSSSPWPWASPGRSMLYIHFKDGTGWIRVEHKDGEQRLVPWPQFEGWDETWPSTVGTVDHALECLHVRQIQYALNYLRQFSAWDKVYGTWRDLKAELDRQVKSPNT